MRIELSLKGTAVRPSAMIELWHKHLPTQPIPRFAANLLTFRRVNTAGTPLQTPDRFNIDHIGSEK